MHVDKIPSDLPVGSYKEEYIKEFNACKKNQEEQRQQQHEAAMDGLRKAQEAHKNALKKL